MHECSHCGNEFDKDKSDHAYIKGGLVCGKCMGYHGDDKPKGQIKHEVEELEHKHSQHDEEVAEDKEEEKVADDWHKDFHISDDQAKAIIVEKYGDS